MSNNFEVSGPPPRLGRRVAGEVSGPPPRFGSSFADDEVSGPPPSFGQRIAGEVSGPPPRLGRMFAGEVSAPPPRFVAARDSVTGSGICWSTGGALSADEIHKLAYTYASGPIAPLKSDIAADGTEKTETGGLTVGPPGSALKDGRCALSRIKAAKDLPPAACDVEICIDVSSSMMNSIDKLKNALVQLAGDAKSEGDRIALVTFHTRSTQILGLRWGGPQNKQVFNSDQICANGGTFRVADGGVARAIYILDSRAFSASRPARIIVMSDGKDNGGLDRQVYANLAATAASCGYVISTFGLGSQGDAPLLAPLAEHTGGAYTYISTLSELNFAEVDFKYPVTWHFFGGGVGTPASPGESSIFKLPSIAPEETRALVFEVAVDKSTPHLTNLAVVKSAKYLAPGNPTPQNAGIISSAVQITTGGDGRVSNTVALARFHCKAAQAKRAYLEQRMRGAGLSETHARLVELKTDITQHVATLTDVKWQLHFEQIIQGIDQVLASPATLGREAINVMYTATSSDMSSGRPAAFRQYGGRGARYDPDVTMPVRQPDWV
ncbi:vWA-like protein [Gonapodya prolifera JEL478]|uniref:VWA-like protein n=1 Tax=Gonapodya prolifera (strain JEL478) TaxID=1344416 RepID=A0A139A0I3_GONPJ|nr:vWA-like protein [Gonapodya prolifera JEL478]|eukprot:KXS10234.1 vWA-like protein [Gonapodya prolifera JEL478]